MTYAEAMDRYGTDKPDLRFGLELVEMTEYFATPVPGVPGAVRRCGRHARRRVAAAQAARRLAGVGQAARRPRAGVRAGRRGRRRSAAGREEPVGAERAGLAARSGASPATASSSPRASRASRRCSARRGSRSATRSGSIDTSRWSFVWVVDAPLFEPVDATDDVAVGSGAWTAVHHAFTSPKPEWIDRFEEDPGKALAYAYDIVCNGNEIGGGSIRIHRRDVQERVFAVMGLKPDEAEEKFGFLLEAFRFGAPPHGGIAFGWDRIVMLLAGADSLRDVIAFPKSGGGFDPLTSAPARSPRSSARRRASTRSRRRRASRSSGDDARAPGRDGRGTSAAGAQPPQLE
jgi:aspartyl-tRNA synthetase